MNASSQLKIQVENLSVYYGEFSALRNVTLPIVANEILTVFGPASGGKTTLLRALNRLIDLNVEASNERATRLYRAHGFQPAVEWPHWVLSAG